MLLSYLFEKMLCIPGNNLSATCLVIFSTKQRIKSLAQGRSRTRTSDLSTLFIGVVGWSVIGDCGTSSLYLLVLERLSGIECSHLPATDICPI